MAAKSFEKFQKILANDRIQYYNIVKQRKASFEKIKLAVMKVSKLKKGSDSARNGKDN